LHYRLRSGFPNLVRALVAHHDPGFGQIGIPADNGNLFSRIFPGKTAHIGHPHTAREYGQVIISTAIATKCNGTHIGAGLPLPTRKKLFVSLYIPRTDQTPLKAFLGRTGREQGKNNGCSRESKKKNFGHNILICVALTLECGCVIFKPDKNASGIPTNAGTPDAQDETRVSSGCLSFYSDYFACHVDGGQKQGVGDSCCHGCSRSVLISDEK
jgi:hypothetical protein